MYNNNTTNPSLLRRCSLSLISRRIPVSTPPFLQTRSVDHVNVHVRCINTTTTTASRPTKRPLLLGSRSRKWLFRLPISVIILSPSLCGGAYLVARWMSQDSEKQIDFTVFHPFEIVSKQSVSSTCSIFTLKSQSRTCPYHELYRDAWKKGVWSVQIKQPQLQIVRSYTPLPPPPDGLNDEDGDSSSTITELRFLIRREPHGEVSEYLHNLPVGAVVHIRGLDVEYEIPSDIDGVLFIAGGTGIAPSLQIAHSLLKRRKSTGFLPRLHILWANRRREDATGGVSSTSIVGSHGVRRPLARFFWAAEQSAQQQQQQLQQPQQASPPPHQSSIIIQQINHLKQASQGRFTLDYLIDEEDSYITQALLKTYLLSLCKTHVKQPSRSDSDSPTEDPAQTRAQVRDSMRSRGLVLISGPDGFISHHAGPKMWAGSGKQSQGPLGGNLEAVLGIGTGVELASSWEVWKL